MGGHALPWEGERSTNDAESNSRLKIEGVGCSAMYSRRRPVGDKHRAYLVVLIVTSLIPRSSTLIQYGSSGFHILLGFVLIGSCDERYGEVRCETVALSHPSILVYSLRTVLSLDVLCMIESK